MLAQSIPDQAIASMPTATAYLLEILETTPSPLASVDHATGNSFINNIHKTDDEETILEKLMFGTQIPFQSLTQHRSV